MTCYVLLAGGLGNQIFQYAAATKTNSEKIVFLDLLNNDRKSFNGFPEIFNLELGSRLELVKPTRSNLILRRYFLWLIGSTAKPDGLRFLLANSKLIRKISSWIVWLTTGIRTEVLLENRQSPHKIFRNTKYPYFLIGYFQSYEVASHLETKLDFLFPNKLSARLMAKATSLESEKAIGIHVRRGDYVGHPTFGLLSNEYFKSVLLSIGGLGRPVIIFSDSKVLTSDILSEHMVHLGQVCPDDFSASEVLFLMSKCSDLILSNSSLSWWAGFIAQARGSNVIAPNPWFKKEYQSADFHVPNWRLSKSKFLP